MSTKNLARTVIEGGREPGMSWRCRDENRSLRAITRVVMDRLTAGDADADDGIIARRPKVGRFFRDKLRPAERWLDRQIGRPWHLVRGELRRKFDTRTTAGRHIVFDHMLPWVEEGLCLCRCREPFTVDTHGLLRRKPPRRFTSPHAPAPLPRPEREVVTWLGGRCVGARGDDHYWFVPTAWGAYRQHHRLGDHDAAFWRSLPAWFRACHDPSKAPGEMTVRLRVS